MSTVNVTTGEIFDVIDPSEARELTTQAQTEFRSAGEHFDRAWSLVEQAIQGGAHVALGYRSVGEYLHEEFAGVLAGLDVAARRVAVKELSGYNLTTRAIAPVLGVGQSTIDRDVQVTRAGSPDIAPAPTLSVVTDSPACDLPAPATPPDTVIGIDGKTYPRVKKASAERAKEVRGRADKGMSSAQIADDLGIGVPQVKSIAKQHGITLRADVVMNRQSKRINHRLVADRVRDSLEVAVNAVNDVDIARLDEEEAREWLDSLSASVKALSQAVNRKIKESNHD